MKTFVFILMIFCTIVSCESTESNNLLSKLTKTCKENANCIVNLKKVVSEDWDTLYVFKPCAQLDKINEVLGFDYPFFSDIADRIVFVKNKAVVYHEDHFPGIEKANKDQVIIRISDTVCYEIFAKENAIFKVTKEKISGVEYIQLIPSKITP